MERKEKKRFLSQSLLFHLLQLSFFLLLFSIFDQNSKIQSLTIEMELLPFFHSFFFLSLPCSENRLSNWSEGEERKRSRKEGEVRKKEMSNRNRWWELLVHYLLTKWEKFTEWASFSSSSSSLSSSLSSLSEFLSLSLVFSCLVTNNHYSYHVSCPDNILERVGKFW